MADTADRAQDHTSALETPLRDNVYRYIIVRRVRNRIQVVRFEGTPSERIAEMGRLKFNTEKPWASGYFDESKRRDEVAGNDPELKLYLKELLNRER